MPTATVWQACGWETYYRCFVLYGSYPVCAWIIPSYFIISLSERSTLLLLLGKSKKIDEILQESEDDCEEH